MRTLDDGFFCNAWWRGFDAAMTVDDFEAQWAPLFCRVMGDALANVDLVQRLAGFWSPWGQA